MKKKSVFSILLFVLICFSGQQSWALTLVDPFSNQAGSTVASFDGSISAGGIYNASTSWFPPAGSIYDNQLSIAQYTYGNQLLRDSYGAYAGTITSNNAMPSTSNFARSTIDTTKSFLSSEANHFDGGGASASSAVIYTNELPTSVSVVGDSRANVRVGVEVYAKTPGGVPLSSTWDNEWYGYMPNMLQGDRLGSVIFKNESGYLSWEVERWSWEVSSGTFPSLIQEKIMSGSNEELDFSKLDSYVTAIINGRTDQYYYSGFASVQSADKASYSYAQLNYNGLNPVPEPASMLLLGMGAAGLAMRRRFHKSA